jgi:hypothetical protein
MVGIAAIWKALQRLKEKVGVLGGLDMDESGQQVFYNQRVLSNANYTRRNALWPLVFDSTHLK